jgi:hypothetical protein
VLAENTTSTKEKHMTIALADDNHEHDELLSIAEAADFLRVPVATMRYWRHCGDAPFSFRIGRHVRYWKTDLILWRSEQGRRPEGGSPQRGAF